MTKWAMMIAHGKKEGTLYVTYGIKNSIAVASTSVDVNIKHCKLRHMSEKGMKVMHSKEKLPKSKQIDSSFCGDFIFRK